MDRTTALGHPFIHEQSKGIVRPEVDAIAGLAAVCREGFTRRRIGAQSANAFKKGHSLAGTFPWRTPLPLLPTSHTVAS
jgi:hypothetical protein